MLLEGLADHLGRQAGLQVLVVIYLCLLLLQLKIVLLLQVLLAGLCFLILDSELILKFCNLLLFLLKLVLRLVLLFEDSHAYLGSTFGDVGLKTDNFVLLLRQFCVELKLLGLELLLSLQLICLLLYGLLFLEFFNPSVDLGVELGILNLVYDVCVIRLIYSKYATAFGAF